MPKMDGISATSLIRQFDHVTPIISMTSNSRPGDIMTYYSSGMNDILPKPFTKEGLLDMLEVCESFRCFIVVSCLYGLPILFAEAPHASQSHPTNVKGSAVDLWSRAHVGQLA